MQHSNHVAIIDGHMTTARMGSATIAECVSVDDRRWSEFVKRCPDALPFHQRGWANVVAHCYGYSSFALMVSTRGGDPLAGIPVVEVDNPLVRRRWVALPFTDECPPLARDASSAATLAGVLAESANAGGAASVEVRGPVQHSSFTPFAVGVTHHLALARDPAQVRTSFSRSQVQRNIARGEKEGVQVHHAQRRDDLTRTYYDLHAQTRRRQGVPVQPRRFFDAIWTEMIERGEGFVLLAYAGSRPVAGAVFLTGAGTVVYKFGASDPTAWSRRPNHVLFWEAIRWSCENGYRSFDFGRTDASNEGLRAFKRGWGTEERPLVYATTGAARSDRGVPRVAATVFRHLPTRVGSFVGERIYRYAA